MFFFTCVLRGGAGGGVGLERIVSVCNIIGHQEVVLWAPTFPTHLDPPSSYHECWLKSDGTLFVWRVLSVHLHPSTSTCRYMYMYEGIAPGS